MFEIENAVTTPLKNFDLVIESFHKAAILALDEVIGNFLPPGLEQIQKIIETRQAAFLNLLDPMQDFGLRLSFG